MRVKIIKLLAQTNLFIADNYELEVQLPDGSFVTSTNAPLDEYLEIKYIKIADKSQKPSNIQIFQIVAEKYFNVQTNSSTPTEAYPYNVEQHQTLVAEDFELSRCVVAGVAMTHAQLDRLFSKHSFIGTPVALPSKQYIGLELKVPFRIGDIKILNNINTFLPNLVVMYHKPDFSIVENTTGVQPYTANEEIISLYIANDSHGSLDVAQIIAEKFFNTKTRIDSSESEPVCVDDSQLVTYDEVYAIFERIRGEWHQLLPSQVKTILDKRIIGTTSPFTEGADALRVLLEKPLYIRQLEAIGLDGNGDMIDIEPIDYWIWHFIDGRDDFETEETAPYVSDKITKVEFYGDVHNIVELYFRKFEDVVTSELGGGGIVGYNKGTEYVIEDLDAASEDYIHALVAYANGDHVDVVSPPHAVNVSVLIKNNTGGALNLDDTDVIVTGKNQFGENKIVTVSFLAQNVAGGDSVVVSSTVALRVITNVHLPQQTTGDANWQFSVGVKDLIGFNRKILASGDIFAVTLNTSDLTPIPAIDLVNYTINMAPVVAGSAITIWFGV